MESITENSKVLSFCGIENIENNFTAFGTEEELYSPSQDEKRDQMVKEECVPLEIKVNQSHHRASHTIMRSDDTVPVVHCGQSNFKSIPELTEEDQVSRQTSTSETDDLTEKLSNPRDGNAVVCEHHSHDRTLVNLKGQKNELGVSGKGQKNVEGKNAHYGNSGSDSDDVIELNLSEETVNVACDFPEEYISDKEDVKPKKFRSVLSSTREVLTEETEEFHELQNLFIPTTAGASPESNEVRQVSGCLNLLYEEKRISQTNKNELKARVTQKPHVEFDIEYSQSSRSLNRKSTEYTANVYHEISYQQEESDYVQIEEGSFKAMSSFSSTQTLEDEVADLPTSTENPYYANKFQYPLIFSKKYLFGWRRPSDITDLQSQSVWKGDCGSQSKAGITPSRRRHSSNIPDKPKRLLNVRLNHLREMWNINSLPLISKNKGKKLERRGTIAEPSGKTDPDEDCMAELAIALEEEKKHEVMLNKLREVVRKCTNTNPALRPSSAEVYRSLRKYS